MSKQIKKTINKLFNKYIKSNKQRTLHSEVTLLASISQLQH